MKLQQIASPIRKDIVPRFPCTCRRGTLCGHCPILLGREDTSSSSRVLNTRCSEYLVELFLLMKGKIQLRSDVTKQRCLAGTWHTLVPPKPEAALCKARQRPPYSRIYSHHCWTPCSSLSVAPQEKSFASPAPTSLIPPGRRLQLQLLSLGARRVSLAVAEELTTEFNTSRKSAPSLFPALLQGSKNLPQMYHRHAHNATSSREPHKDNIYSDIKLHCEISLEIFLVKESSYKKQKLKIS